MGVGSPSHYPVPICTSHLQSHLSWASATPLVFIILRHLGWATSHVLRHHLTCSLELGATMKCLHYAHNWAYHELCQRLEEPKSHFLPWQPLKLLTGNRWPGSSSASHPSPGNFGHFQGHMAWFLIRSNYTWDKGSWVHEEPLASLWYKRFDPALDRGLAGL